METTHQQHQPPKLWKPKTSPLDYLPLVVIVAVTLLAALASQRAAQVNGTVAT